MPHRTKKAHSTKDIDAQHPSDEEDDEFLKPDFLDNEDEEAANSDAESSSDRDSPEPPPKAKAKAKAKKVVQKESQNAEAGGRSQVVDRRSALLDRTNNNDPQPARRGPSQRDTIAALEKRLNETQTALQKSQEAVVQLNQKRKHAAVDDGTNDQTKSRSKKSKHNHRPTDEDSRKRKHARDLGKKFVFGYVFWTDPDIIFGSGVGTDSDEEHEDEAPGEDPNADPDSPASVIEPRTGWNLKSQQGIDTYINAHMENFKKTLGRRDRRAWSKEWFQESFCEGARKFRADLLKGTADRPMELFGINTDDFMDKASRPHLPQVKDLLLDDNFLLGPGNGKKVERIYRHDCIVKILLRMYWGQQAAITGERSKMARTTYGSKFKGKSVSLVQLAAAAVVAKVILEGDHEFSAADKDRVKYFWDRLHFLYKMKNRFPEDIEGTIHWINRKVGGLEDNEDAAEEENALEEEIMRNDE